MNTNLENYNLLKKESICEIYIKKDLDLDSDNDYEYLVMLNIVNTKNSSILKSLELDLFKEDIYELSSNSICQFTGFELSNEQKAICYIERLSEDDYDYIESTEEEYDEMHYKMLKAWGFEDESIDLFF